MRFEHTLLAQGKDAMYMSAHSLAARVQHHATSATIETTLYDLIAAISDEVEPEDEGLVTATVVHLLNSGQVKFSGDSRNVEVVCGQSRNSFPIATG